MVEHAVWVREAGGSSPLIPTMMTINESLLNAQRELALCAHHLDLLDAALDDCEKIAASMPKKRD